MIKLIKANPMLIGLFLALILAWGMSIRSYVQSYDFTGLYVTGSLTSIYIIAFTIHLSRKK